MKKAFPILAVMTALFLAYAFYQAMFVAPTDALQGDVYRIIFYHVPSAWTAFLLFFINFVRTPGHVLMIYLLAVALMTISATKIVPVMGPIRRASRCDIPAPFAMRSGLT